MAKRARPRSTEIARQSRAIELQQHIEHMTREIMERNYQQAAYEVRRNIAAYAASLNNRIEETSGQLSKTYLQGTTSSAINGGRKASVQFEYPDPLPEIELSAIQKRSIQLAHVADAVAGLGLDGVDVKVQIAGLHELAERCEKLARNIGMHAVGQGGLSQAELSRLLGVHQLTVGRWVKDATANQTDTSQ